MVIYVNRVVVVGAGLAGVRSVEALRAQGLRRQDHVDRSGAAPALRPPTLVEGRAARRLRLQLSSTPTCPRWGSTSGPASRPRRCARTPWRPPRASSPTTGWSSPPGPSRSRLPGDGPQHVLRTLDDSAGAAREAASRRPRGGHRRRLDRRGGGHGRPPAGCAVTVIEASSAPLALAVGAEIGARTLGWYEATSTCGSTPWSGRWTRAASSWRRRVRRGARGRRRDRRAPRRRMAGRRRHRPGQRRRHRRAPAHLDAGRGRRGRLRRLVVAPLRGQAAGRALGHRAERARGGRRRPCWAARRPTTRCPISGRSSSATWSSTRATIRPAERLLYRGDSGRASGRPAGSPTEDTLAAVLAVDRPRDLVQGRRIIEARTPLDAERLVDPDVPLRDCVV